MKGRTVGVYLGLLALLVVFALGLRSVDAQPRGWHCRSFDSGVTCDRAAMVWSGSDGAAVSRRRR